MSNSTHKLEILPGIRKHHREMKHTADSSLLVLHALNILPGPTGDTKLEIPLVQPGIRKLRTHPAHQR